MLSFAGYASASKSLALIAIVLLFTSAPRADAQQTPPRLLIDDAPACPSCRILTRTLVTLGAESGDAALIGPPGQVRMGHRGEYWVVESRQPPAIFDSNGAFKRRLGRSGSGPGEYLGAVDMLKLGPDSILAIDRLQQRASVLTADFRHARSFPLPWISTYHALVRRTLYTSGFVGTPSAAGWPLHSVGIDGSSGQIVKSFGTGSPASSGPSTAGLLNWRLASTRDGFWSMDVAQYRLISWSNTGTATKELLRKPAWFPELSQVSLGNRSTPPDPYTFGLAEDEGGLLWVAVRVPSSNWRDVWLQQRSSPGGSGAGDVTATSMELHKLFSFWIEVIDPSAGKVLARLRTNERIVSLLPFGRAAVYEERADGVPRVRIVQFTLEGRSE